MKVYRSLETCPVGEAAAVTLGTYDGVHLGHVQILETLQAHARRLEAQSVVLTFHPHPRHVLFPEDNSLRLIQTMDERIAALEGLGIDQLVIIPFSHAFSRITSRQFVEEILLARIRMRAMIVGHDHRFGKNRAGGMQELRELADYHQFEVHKVEARYVDDITISSTKIRNALEMGDVEKAGAFLGRPFSMEGQIVRGQQLGRTLGFPTANLHIADPHKIIPGRGVYVVEVAFEGQRWGGMMNIGVRPTVGGELAQTLEVHILDFDQDIYGKSLRVYFHARLRPEEKFASLEALKRQLEVDRSRTADMLQRSVRVQGQ